MGYFELRDQLVKVIPRKSILEALQKETGLVKEKGRKSNYKEFSLETGEFVSIQRLLNKEEINSFLEVSLRASHCPMPLNADVYDALRCGFGCKYCLPPTSKVLMFNGIKKSIGRVKKGDRVVSYNIEKNRIEISEVTNTMRRKEKNIFLIKTKSKKIEVTGEHPIFTKRGWIEAKDIRKDDEVLIW